MFLWAMEESEERESPVRLVAPINGIPEALNFALEIVVPVGQLNNLSGSVKRAMNFDSHFSSLLRPSWEPYLPPGE